MSPTKIIPIIPAQSLSKNNTSKPKGRAVDLSVLAQVQTVLGAASRAREYLIENLHLLQDHFGHLSAAHLTALGREMKLSQAEVFEVATFYHHFDVVREGEKAPAKITVRVCESLSCALAGAEDLQQKLHQAFGQRGQDVRIIAAPCVGRCSEAPVAVVGQNALSHATLTSVSQAIKTKKTQAVMPKAIGFDGYVKCGGYQLLADCLSGKYTREHLISVMEHSGLRGLGGAGFPTGRKWRLVAAEPAPRVMAVNIDEGEPGTFKDRVYLERDPHRFLEGMLIAAWAAGVSAIYIYLRDEYHGVRQLLERELALLKKQAGFGLPPIELRRGAGAYICGEESAMIESIEGKRGLPRLRPPYVAQVGLFGRPTLEHNMESVYWVRQILEQGAAWFAAHGRNGRKGLRSFSVSGRVNNPGMHVAPAGITLRELIDEYCGGMQAGHKLYAYLPGGASGGILPASLDNVPLDFDTLQPYGCFIGSAAIVVLSQHDTAQNAARNLLQFFADESCGQCTPCRVGTAKAVGLLSEKEWNVPLLQELSNVMIDASICGLGQAAPNPILSVIKYFPHELNGKINKKISDKRASAKNTKGAL